MKCCFFRGHLANRHMCDAKSHLLYLDDQRDDVVCSLHGFVHCEWLRFGRLAGEIWWNRTCLFAQINRYDGQRSEARKKSPSHYRLHLTFKFFEMHIEAIRLDRFSVALILAAPVTNMRNWTPRKRSAINPASIRRRSDWDEETEIALAVCDASTTHLISWLYRLPDQIYHIVTDCWVSVGLSKQFKLAASRNARRSFTLDPCTLCNPITLIVRMTSQKSLRSKLNEHPGLINRIIGTRHSSKSTSSTVLNAVYYESLQRFDYALLKWQRHIMSGAALWLEPQY